MFPFQLGFLVTELVTMKGSHQGASAGAVRDVGGWCPPARLVLGEFLRPHQRGSQFMEQTFHSSFSLWEALPYVPENKEGKLHSSLISPSLVKKKQKSIQVLGIMMSIEGA